MEKTFGEMMIMPAALEGIRVLDLSQLFPGPYCTMILADLGAEVIKVEPVGVGDFARLFGFFFQQVNRNKKSIALNLKSQRAREILQRLARSADVLVEGFRPGTTARLGVDYPTLKASNSRLVYCSISGFGQEGPYRDRPGHDINYLSMGGALGLTRDREGKPVKLGIEVVDITSGLNAAIAVLAALLARERSGEGQYIDISMLDCALSLIPMEAGYYLETGEVLANPALDILPHYGIFETADREYLVLGIVHEDHFWEELCDALEMAEARDLDAAQRIMRRDELEARLQGIFATRSLSEWLERLSGYDIPYSRLNSVGEALEDPHLRQRGTVVELPGGEGTRRYLGSPIRLSETPPNCRTPGPELGEHTQELLEGLGLSGEEIRVLREAGAIE